MTSHDHSPSSQEAMENHQKNQCPNCGDQQPQSQPQLQQQQQALTPFQRQVSMVRTSEQVNSVIRILNRKRNKQQLGQFHPLVSIHTGVIIPDFPNTLEELAKLDESKVDAIMRELGIGWFARGRVEVKQMWIRMNWVPES